MSGRQLAEFSDYPGMLDALRARVRELQIAGAAFDAYAGLPDKYLAKLIGANPVRRIGMRSMGALFAALGVSCVLIEDPVATERLKKALPPRNGSFVRSALRITFTGRHFKAIGRKGRQARWQKLTPTQRATIMRALAQRRWGR